MQTKKATHPGKLGEHTAGGTIGAAVGTVTGAVVGAATTATQTAAVGTVIAGPIGTAVGAGIGGVVGALAGKGIAQVFNPTTEDEYWRMNYMKQSYVSPGESYETYQPAYRQGVEAYTKYNGQKFDDIEPKLKDEWDVSGAMLPWGEAKKASRDAYDRLHKLSTDDIDTRTGE